MWFVLTKVTVFIYLLFIYWYNNNILVFQIRLSVGLEDTEDLIEDLDKALKEAVSGVMPLLTLILNSCKLLDNVY